MRVIRESGLQGYFLDEPFPASIFVFATVNSKYVNDKIVPMAGFEPRTCGIGSYRSANWAKPTIMLNILRKY